MTSIEFKKATKLAFSEGFSWLEHDMSILDGCGLPDFSPVAATINTIAAFIKYQCGCLDGSIDQEELNNCRYIFCKLRRVQMVG